MFNFLPFNVKIFILFVLPLSILILFIKAQSGYHRACSVKGVVRMLSEAVVRMLSEGV